MDLLKKYRPVLYLHTQEKYHPSSIFKYINMCYFVRDGDILNKTFSQIAKSDSLEHGKGVIMEVKEEFRSTFKDIAFNENQGKKTINPDVYCYIYKKGNKKYLRYSFFYNFNGAKQVLGFIPIGAHNADMETICIELVNNVPKRVSLSQHGYKQILNYDELEKENNRIVVYSALNSHAHYPEKGTYFRFLGLGNDNCSKGLRVNPNIYLINETSPLFLYKGNLGNGPNVGPIFKDNSSSNCFKFE